MSKIAVIYWSGTGNTEAMANIIETAAGAAGAEVAMMTSDAVDNAVLAGCTGVALGCPSMGDEVLEETEFEPMWQDVKGQLAGKKVALFGSYGWGDGEWMRNWVEDAKGTGLELVSNVICQEAPEDEAEADLKALVAALV